MQVIPIGLYVFFSFLVAWSGSSRKLGFWVSFFLCLLFTPLIMGVIFLLTTSKE